MTVQGIRQGPLESNKNGNMDISLLEDIKKTIREEKMQCNFVADDQATQLIQNLAAKFSFDTNQLFIWSNKDVSEIYNYEEDPSSWEPLMQNLLTKFDDQLFLAVTDEEFFPWDVLNCSKDSFIKLLREQRYFEYFIFDFSFACVLFDTHDNSLILFED
jgi:hypothetical protein